jgi:hypothetical protein
MVSLPLRNRSGEIVANVIVDDADAEWASQWRWVLNSNGYAWRSINGGTRHRYMHRELAGAVEGDGMLVDHINRDRLDNRRANLRLVTPAQSAQNKPALSGRYRGVSWDSNRQRWQANAQLDGRRYYIGRYATEEAANAAVRVWRREHMPFSEEAIP